MAIHHSSVVLPSCIAALIAFVVSAQHAPLLHLLPYVFFFGTVAGILASFLLQSWGARANIAIKTVSLPSNSALYLSNPASFVSQTSSLRTRRLREVKPIAEVSVSLSRSLDALLSLIIQDNVNVWLHKITGSELFSDEVRYALHVVLSRLSKQLANRDLVRLLVAHALPVFNDHFEAFLKAESAVGADKQASNHRRSFADAVSLEITTKFKSGKLHPAASLASSKSVTPQQRHLRKLVEGVILPHLAPQMVESPSVRALIRETVACAVICPIVQTLSGPDFLFQQVEIHGQAQLFGSETLSTQPQARRAPQRRLSDSSIGDHDHTRVAQPCKSPGEQSRTSRPATTTLYDTLYDVAGLSYFMEYMDTHGGLVSYVQFWITVDGFRTSIERANLADRSDPLQAVPQAWSNADRQMIQRLYQKFLLDPSIAPLAEQRPRVRTFLEAGPSASIAQYRAALAAMSDAQASVYREMDTKYFPQFRDSDIHRQWIGPVIDGPRGSSQSTQLLTAPSKPKPLRVPQISPHPSSRGLLNGLKESASSTDIVNDARKSALMGGVRRSLDEDTRRSLLFGDDDDSDGDSMSNSAASLDHDASMIHSSSRQGVVREGHATKPVRPPIAEANRSLSEAQLGAESLSKTPLGFDTNKLSLDSLGLLGTPSKRTVFTTDDLFGEGEDLWEDDDSQHDVDRDNEVREAKAGDLGLPEALQSLNVEIEKLETQQVILTGLASKAELTNNSAEMKILRKSLSELERDLRRRELQRQQYVVQSSDNNLYRKTELSITSVQVGREHDGREFAVYEVHMARHVHTNMPRASWVASRRYSEFHNLHRRLRSRFPYVRDLPFPKRQVVLTLQTDLVQRRRAALEQYLRHLLDDNALCQSLELRAFLSEQPIRLPKHRSSAESTRRDTVSRLYAALSEGLEDFVGNASVLDQLSLAGQNLIAQATAAGAPTLPNHSLANGKTPSLISTSSESLSTARANPTSAAEAQAEIAAFDKGGTESGDSDVLSHRRSAKSLQKTTFIAPIAQCFSSLFQPRSGNNWLRGRAVVIVLQQLLGGTVERRVRDAFVELTTSSKFAQYVDLLREALRPNGQARPPPPIRPQIEQSRTRRNAEDVLCALFVENVGSIVGTNTARDAARRIVRCFSNERLNLHFWYTLLDAMIPVVLASGDGTAAP